MGRGFKELNRVFVKDSKPPVKDEGDNILSNYRKGKEQDSATKVESPVADKEDEPEADTTKESDTKVEPPEPEKKPEQQFNPTDIVNLINKSVDSALADERADHQKEIDRIKAEMKAEQDKVSTEAKEHQKELETKLQQEKDSLNRLEDVLKLHGNGQPVKDNMPNFNIKTSRPDKVDGALADFQGLYRDSRQVQKTTSNGRIYFASDNREVDAFVRQNRVHLTKDLDAAMGRNGLLRGKIERDAATSISDIIGGFLPTLSAILRSNNRPGFIFHQFPTTRIDIERGNGDKIDIPRAAFIPAPENPDDRLLSGGGTFVDIDSGNQNLSTGTVRAEIQEWGLGKNSQYPPVAIPAFVNAYSAMDLIRILERNLLYDYFQWEDKKIRSLWTPTSRVVYNDSGEVTTTVGDVASGDDGSLTEQFLNNLYAYMRALQIPTMADGCYGLAANTYAVTSLKDSLGTKWEAANEQDLMNLTNILRTDVVQPGEIDRVSGYVGKYCNFHIFDSNAFGVGAAGTEGAQTETIGGASNTTRSSYAFGADTIGRGIGTEMEIVDEGLVRFGRVGRYIWRSEEAFVAVDVDPTGYSDTTDVPQQLRVLEVRTTSAPV